MQRLFALLAGLNVVSATALGHAAPRLLYRAPPDCPKSGEFVAAVRARGGNVELEPATADAIDVVIERAGDDYRGTMRVQSAGQSSEAREVRSAACSEVADGLAIVTALASQTGNIPEAATAAVPDTNGSAATKKEAPYSPPAAPKPPPAPSTRLHTAGQFHDETLNVTSGELRVRNDTALTLTGGALFGMIPSRVVPRIDLTLARTNFITTPNGAGHIIGGILRGRWTILAPTEYRHSDWSTRFAGLRASMGGCSQLAYDLSGLVLLTCGEIGAGIAKVTTKDPNGHTTSDQTVGLASVAFEFDARYNLGRLFQLGLTVGGEAWLNQIKAHAGDGSEIFHTNQLGGYALAGIGMHFW